MPLWKTLKLRELILGDMGMQQHRAGLDAREDLRVPVLVHSALLEVPPLPEVSLPQGRMIAVDISARLMGWRGTVTYLQLIQNALMITAE